MIEGALLSPNTHRRMTIYGLGGCGKSALALEFAYHALAGHARRLVFWVPAISPESFKLAYREIGVRLRIPGISDDNADAKRLVKETLSLGNVGDWLMVVDNVDDSQVLLGVDDESHGSARLIDYIPHSNRGAILFTTRSRKAATDLTQGNVLELNDMGKAEARQLLARRTTRQALLNDEAAVGVLLESLAGLPLAIVQAAAFMNQNDTPVSEYVSLLQHAGTKAELFSEHFEDSSRYRSMDSTIAKTWHISFEQIRRQDPLAADYLSFIACIDRINIPQSLLLSGGSILQQTKALGTLTGYAFITERQQTVPGSSKEKLFDMHRLVHMALIWWLEGHGERADWAGTAAARAKELVPYGGHEGKEVWSVYLPHATYVAGLVEAVDSAMSASLLERLGSCQESLGQYASAEMSHRKASFLRKEVLGHEHPDTLTSINNLALVLTRQGKYEEAEAMNRQTLARYEEVLGHEHPFTLTSMGNLAGVLDRQGKYEEAEAMHRQTLARSEKVLGPEHPDTLTSVYCLAYLLTHRRRYNESLALYERACAGHQAVLGKDHPTTHACRQHYADALALHEQHQLAVSPTIADSTRSARTGKGSKLLRGLAKIGIRSPKPSAR